MEELQQKEEGTATYSYLSPFMDISTEEFAATHFGLRPDSASEEVPEAPLLNIAVADSKDWVKDGAVNPIKNQGSCGSCWAFSTVANIEGAGFVATGKLVSLSEQELVDCGAGNGCGGGFPPSALSWVAKGHGLASESAYPYKHKDGSCKSYSAVTTITGSTRISKDEDQIAQSLIQYGPLSIDLDASGLSPYSGGVISNPSCSKTRHNHAVAIVGYGTDKYPYFKIRNSWGTSYGEKGYVRLIRGKGACGLNNNVVTATGIKVKSSNEVVV